MIRGCDMQQPDGGRVLVADLFVSYSREDKARAADIVHLLEDHGWDVFWDQEMRSGTLWPKVLEEELLKARCLVALWTTTSISSRWVRIEAYEALQNEKLVPVLLDKVRPPLEFRQTQTFDLIGWKGDRSDPRLSQLLADLTPLVKAPGSHGPVQRPVRIVVPPTLQREIPDTPQTGNAEHDASTGPLASTTVATSLNWWLGAGVAAAVIAIAWAIVAIDSSPAPVTPAQLPVAPPVEIATPAPSPPQPLPEVPTPAKKTEVAVVPVPAAPVSKPKPPQRPRSARCLAIEEKFQQTGQITAAERDFLRGKECQS